ncbi:hypothetical protein VKT23_018630 [Stygiomarasmius scandens]|uniref:Uncharacterized protein n=1 Tax=Marasmiellus scandens TaxID=2682957 RepID=A0ABR1ISY9_9AGAR
MLAKRALEVPIQGSTEKAENFTCRVFHPNQQNLRVFILVMLRQYTRCIHDFQNNLVHAGKRGFSQSSVNKRFSQPSLTTFIPKQLKPTDYVNLSGLLRPQVKYRTVQLQPFYESAEKFRLNNPGRKHNYIPFPPNTSGFYYLHKPTGNVPKFAGGIRFRICPSNDPMSFERGSDLLLSRGLPWQITNWILALDYVHWGMELVSSGEMDIEIIELCQKLAKEAKLKHTPRQTVVYALKQPFSMTFGRRTARIWVANEGKLVAFTLWNDILSPYTVQSLNDQIEETALVCFDMEKGNLVLRLLSVPPAYKGKMEYSVGNTMVDFVYRGKTHGDKAIDALDIIRTSTFTYP